MSDKRPTLSSSDRKVAEMIRDRKGFKTYGALSARVLPDGGLGVFDSGRLSGEDEERFREDCTHILYCVWSYSTPIAWWTGTVRGWHVVEQTFSPTTGKHQGKLYLIPRGDLD